MELRQLRCLIAVSETLHFGRAAQAMDMLPASFGRQIKLLEESLGSRLLIRTTRNVSLTPAGRDFVVAARDIIDRADELERQFRTRRGEESRLLRIGAIDSAAIGLMPQLLPHVSQAAPDIELEMVEDKSWRLIPRILSGRLDAAIVRPPETLDPRLVFEPLFHETPVVAVPSDHRLAERERVEISDMADEPLIVPDRRSRPYSHDLTIKLFLDQGLSARVAQIAQEKQTIVSLVGTGVGLAIVPKWTARLAIEGVKFLDLAPPKGRIPRELALSIVWLRDTRNTSRDAFVDVLRDHRDRLGATA